MVTRTDILAAVKNVPDHPFAVVLKDGIRINVRVKGQATASRNTLVMRDEDRGVDRIIPLRLVEAIDWSPPAALRAPDAD